METYYTVIESPTKWGLMDGVNAELKAPGVLEWTMAGGPVVMIGGNGEIMWYQALTIKKRKYEKA